MIHTTNLRKDAALQAESYLPKGFSFGQPQSPYYSTEYLVSSGLIGLYRSPDTKIGEDLNDFFSVYYRNDFATQRMKATYQEAMNYNLT